MWTGRPTGEKKPVYPQSHDSFQTVERYATYSTSGHAHVTHGGIIHTQVACSSVAVHQGCISWLPVFIWPNHTHTLSQPNWPVKFFTNYITRPNSIQIVLKMRVFLSANCIWSFVPSHSVLVRKSWTGCACPYPVPYTTACGTETVPHVLVVSFIPNRRLRHVG